MIVRPRPSSLLIPFCVCAAVGRGYAAPVPPPAAAPPVTSPLPAAPGREPRFAPATLFNRRAITQRTLAAGVRSVVLSTRAIPDTMASSGRSGVVCVQVWVRAGSRFETTNTAGAAGVVEEACMHASQGYPTSSASENGGPRGALRGIGAVAGGQTSRDAAFFSATVSSAYYPSALHILADAVLHPRLTDADIAAAKDAAAAQIIGRVTNALTLASDSAYYAAFSRHPYKRPAGGSAASIGALSAPSVRAYHRARYSGANISIIIVGDVDATQAHQLVAREFAGAPAAAAQPTIPPETAPGRNRVVELRRPLRAATVAVAWGAPGITAPEDVVAMDVLLAYWKEGSQAALRRPLLGRDPDDAPAPENTPGSAPPANPPVGNPEETPGATPPAAPETPANPETPVAPATPANPDAPANPDTPAAPDTPAPPPDAPATPAQLDTPPVPDAPAAPPDADSTDRLDDGLALAYDVDFLTQRDPSLMIVTMVTLPATRQAAVRALLDEVGRVRQNGLNEDDLSRAKASLRRQYLEGGETPSGAAGALGFYEMISTYDFALTYLDRTQRVTNADVRRIAQKYLSSSNYVQIVIEPQAPRPTTPGTDPGVITAALPFAPATRMSRRSDPSS